KLHFAKYLFLYPFLSGFYGYFNTFPSLSGSFFVSFYSVSPFTLPRYTFSSLPAFTFTIDQSCYYPSERGQKENRISLKLPAGSEVILNSGWSRGFSRYSVFVLLRYEDG
ncbi:hypothetical protein, partial [uncultured Holdemania sp.]|uniref:hypothetical protein n=1 Tax=uncultured Holdemania sp. TaxID=527664 RepID=UPI00280394DC